MKLMKDDLIWLVKGDGSVRPGRFKRYLGRGRCRIYLVNDGFYNVPRGLIKARKSAVNGRTLELVR